MEFLTAQWLKTVPSTNTRLLEMVADNPDLSSGTVIAAESQTAGRGRFERKWQSTPGKDLTFSFFLRANAPVNYLPSLPMACALGVVEYLDSLGLAASTKWPNDVLVRGKKICGILSERIAAAEDNLSVVVGVGLNINMNLEEANRIDKPATSIAIASGKAQPLPVTEALDRLLPHLATWINRWKTGGFPSFREDWERQSIGLGQAVEVHSAGKVITGVAKGFGEAGELLLRELAGGLYPVWSGDLVLPEQP
ncbi:MAG: biotin--[acetyl-CoA-carboxylase] ligase [Planctomycetes bacterium]|nr:biotin--[acetyl-CoA-carboxylase] ligase [Planctomycetota bacterium]